MKNLLIIAVVALVAGAGGFLLPRLLFSESSPAGARGSEAAAAGPSPVDSEPGYIPFGAVVVNLNEGRLNRYLRVNITLLVAAAEQHAVSQKVDKQKVILKNWLIGYLADKTLQEVAGTAGYNRARREIQDHFNELLFPDGLDRIEEVLFEEFTVQ